MTTPEEKVTSREHVFDVSKVTQEYMKLPENSNDGKLAFVLHNVFSEKECEEYIRATEEKGYEMALLNIGFGILRFLRYDPGEYFKPHEDSSYVRENGETSYITVHLYLNEGFEGGSTTFTTSNKRTTKERVECIPKTGSVLVFQHHICHEGSLLEKGRTYTVRTDVMFSG